MRRALSYVWRSEVQRCFLRDSYTLYQTEINNYGFNITFMNDEHCIGVRVCFRAPCSPSGYTPVSTTLKVSNE